jgi:hypothetical protein
MGFFDPTDTHGVPLNLPYAEDIMQVTHGLTGLLDLGALSLLGPLAAPAGAPAITLQAGSLTGAYKWQVYWISGVMDGRGVVAANAHITGRTLAGPATATQNPSAQQATVSIAALTPPTGVIGWGVARTLASGTTFLLVPGSEQFLSLAGTLPATFIDNTSDGALVTAVQTVNTTGTSLGGFPLVTYMLPADVTTTSSTNVNVGPSILLPDAGTLIQNGRTLQIKAGVLLGTSNAGGQANVSVIVAQAAASATALTTLATVWSPGTTTLTSVSVAPIYAYESWTSVALTPTQPDLWLQFVALNGSGYTTTLKAGSSFAARFV